MPLFIGWGQVVRGRQKHALQVFQESMEYIGRLQQEGRIERFEVTLLAPHSGDLNGFAMLYGDRQSRWVRRSSSSKRRRTSSAPRGRGVG